MRCKRWTTPIHRDTVLARLRRTESYVEELEQVCTGHNDDKDYTLSHCQIHSCITSRVAPYRPIQNRRLRPASIKTPGVPCGPFAGIMNLIQRKWPKPVLPPAKHAWSTPRVKCHPVRRIWNRRTITIVNKVNPNRCTNLTQTTTTKALRMIQNRIDSAPSSKISLNSRNDHTQTRMRTVVMTLIIRDIPYRDKKKLGMARFRSLLQ